MDYQPDLGLLDDLGSVMKHIVAPLVAVFEFGDKKLVYVGTRHNHKDHMMSGSFDAINYCFDNFKIDCVVTECESTRTLADFEACIGTPDMNELIYAPYIGNLKNIPYVFADSSRKDWLADVLCVNVDAIKDMQTFFVLDDAYRYKRHYGKSDTIEHAINNVVRRFWPDDYPAPMNKSEFIAYCKQQLGIDITDENISDVLSLLGDWHRPDKNGNPLNRAWAYVGEYSRDPQMLKNSFNAVNKYQCVLVTAGAAHFYSQRRVLEQAFGMPQMIYEFPHTLRRDQNTGSKVCT